MIRKEAKREPKAEDGGASSEAEIINKIVRGCVKRNIGENFNSFHKK
jgi:hypothetical protein